MKLILDKNELIQELKNYIPNSGTVGYMSLFFEDIHPGHSYALLKLRELCDKTIAIPLINKEISYGDAVKHVKKITNLIPSDYVYLPKNAIQYENKKLISEIRDFIDGKEYNNYLESLTPKLDNDLINRAFKFMPLAAPRCSISYTDMEYISLQSGCNIISIRGNKDLHQDLQVFLYCGLENLNVHETARIAAFLIRKQKRIFCYTWRDPSFFPPRRNNDFLVCELTKLKGIDPNSFGEKINNLEELKYNKLDNHNYYLLSANEKSNKLYENITVEDYNNRRAFLVISTKFPNLPYFPNDFLHLNFRKSDALIYQDNKYTFKKDYFSKEIDNKIDNMISEVLKYSKPGESKKIIIEEFTRI